jgi:hypothetical protein
VARHQTRLQFNCEQQKHFYLLLSLSQDIAQPGQNTSHTPHKCPHHTTCSVSGAQSMWMQGSDQRKSRASELATSTGTNVLSWGLCFGKGILKHFLSVIFVIATFSTDMVMSSTLPQKQLQHHTYYIIYLHFVQLTVLYVHLLCYCNYATCL